MSIEIFWTVRIRFGYFHYFVSEFEPDFGYPHILTQNERLCVEWYVKLYCQFRCSKHTCVSLQYGDTPLHTAARYGHAGVTRILISAKCTVSETNKVCTTWSAVVSGSCMAMSLW